MLKCLDPEKRWIWQHPEDVDVRFEYKALTGPTLGLGNVEAIFQHYLDRCITAAWNVNVNGVDYAEWRGTPVVRWSAVLPPDVSNGLTMAILNVSRLNPAESGESSVPRGQQGPESGNAADAAEPAGAPCGKATAKKRGPTSTPKSKSRERLGVQTAICR